MAKDKKINSIAVGVVPAVLLKLLNSTSIVFTPSELLVIEAIKRSSSELKNASIPELRNYVSQYSGQRLSGFVNNVKGIYHELLFAESENSDGDNVSAELFELTNHPGADVILTNIETGEVTEIQLKSTDNIAYVREHMEKYPDIDVAATGEVADRLEDVLSTGISNSAITNSVESVADTLQSSNIDDAAGVSGLISSAMNAKAVLDGSKLGEDAARSVAADIGVAVVSAGILELILG